MYDNNMFWLDLFNFFSYLHATVAVASQFFSCNCTVRDDFLRVRHSCILLQWFCIIVMLSERILENYWVPISWFLSLGSFLILSSRNITLRPLSLNWLLATDSILYMFQHFRISQLFTAITADKFATIFNYYLQFLRVFCKLSSHLFHLLRWLAFLFLFLLRLEEIQDFLEVFISANAIRETFFKRLNAVT